MRLVPRVLATTTTAVLLVAGLAGPVHAAQSLQCLTSPINNTNEKAVRYAGTSVPPSPQTVSATSSNGTKSDTGTPATSVPMMAADGSFAGSLDTSNLKDGLVTLSARGLDNTNPVTCTVGKDTVAPGSPALTTDPTATINSSNDDNLRITATLDEPDLRDMTLAVSDGALTRSVTIPRQQSGPGGVYTTTFDVTDMADGAAKITVTATAADAFGNTTATSKKLDKDARPPAAPSLATTDVSSGNALTRVNSSEPGSGDKVRVTATTDENSTFSFVVTDSAGATATLAGPAAAAKSASADFDPYVFADGPVRISVTATDTAGNRGAPGAKTLVKDTSVPAVTGLAIAPSPINNARQSSVTVSGIASRVAGSTEPSEAGTSVTVTLTGAPTMPVTDDPTAVSKTVTIDPATGGFSATFDTSGFDDTSSGEQITATAVPTDPNGNKGSAASTGATKDTAAPAKPGRPISENATPANLTSVTYRGAAESGSSVVVTVTDSAGAKLELPAVTSGSGGTYESTFDATTLAQGPFTLVAKATDAAGNTSVASDPGSAVKDTQPMVLTGRSPEGTSSPTTPVRVSFSEPLNRTASTLFVRDGSSSAVPGTVSYADGDRTIVFTPTSPFGTGSYTATYDVRSAGPGSDRVGPDSFSFLVDATKPDAPTLQSITNPVNRSNAGAVQASGTSEPGSSVVVTVTDSAGKAVSSGPVTAGPDGGFTASVDVTTLADGRLSATGKATDSAGNTSAAGNTLTTTKDTVAPVANNDASATDTTQASPRTTVTGTTTEANAPVTVTLRHGSNAGPTVTATGRASGTSYSLSVDASGLADGAIAVSVVVTDAAGNPSEPATTAFRKDATGPTVTDLAATDVRRDSGGRTTVTGRTGEAGTSVSLTVVDQHGNVANASPAPDAASPGAFTASIDVSSLADGPLTVTAFGRDSKGNTGEQATAGARKDVVAPLISDLAATSSNASQSTTTISGRTEPLSSVALSVSDGTTTNRDTVTADSAGAFSKAVSLTGLRDGSATVSATATDAIGNVGPTATTSTVRDSAAPVVTGLTSTDTSASRTASTVTGRTEPGSSVALSATSPGAAAPVTGTAIADGSGAFSKVLELSSLPDGRVTIAATPTDSAGNTGPAATTTSTKDTSGPAVTGLAATPSTPDTPVSTVTGRTEDGASVTLSATDSANVEVVATATMASDGSFSGRLDMSGMADGAIRVAATATDAAGNAGPISTVTTTRSSEVPNQGRFTPLGAPVRVMDSRTGLGTPAGLKQGAVRLDLSSRIPSAANGAVLNVTVTRPEAGGYVVVYPAGTTRPGTSNVNFAAGQTQANEVVTSLTDRAATVFVSSAGRAHVVVDLVGHFTPDSGTGGYLSTLAPQRVLGEAARRNLGSSVGSSSVDVDLSQVLPLGSTAAILNVTVAAPSLSGYVVAYPANTARPSTSNVNFAAGQTQANEVVTRVGADRKVRLTLSRGAARVIVDVVGAAVPSSTAGSKRFTPLETPVRALDTRKAIGISGTTPRTSSTPTHVLLTSAVPADATGVILNVTSTRQAGSGYVVAYPTGSARPGTSNLNFRQGSNQANEVIVAIGSDRRVTLAVGGRSASTHLVADVVGYLR